MMTGRWNLKLDRFRSRMGENVQRKAERITQNLVNRFIQDSPVRTGAFRSSWNVSEGNPIFVKAAGGSPESPSSAPKITVRAVATYPIFYISNGQPYGQQLEKGTSTQAPLGIVRVNIASVR